MTLKKRYSKEIVPRLMKILGEKNPMAVPTVKMVTVAVGIQATQKDAKFIDTVEQTLTRITGQKPIDTKAKKSVSGFKVREGMVVGKRVTLRGERLWSFLAKLLTFTFPRMTDFRGLSPKNVDATGNLSVGFREYLSFPESGPMKWSGCTASRSLSRPMPARASAAWPYSRSLASRSLPNHDLWQLRIKSPNQGVSPSSARGT